MDSLHILPGKGLSGHFFLDMSLLKAIKKVRGFSTKLPCVNVIEESGSKRILLEIPDNRLRLVFDDLYQKLLIIEIDCRGSVLPCLPIMYESQMYTNYSDILKTLDPSSKPVNISEDLMIEQHQGVSVLIRNNTLVKVFIHKGNSLPIQRNNLKVKQYQIKLLDKVVMKHSTGKMEDIAWNIIPEALIDLMGPPDYVRYKTSNETIHYFYTYIGEGIDFLFESSKNQLIKIFMHTNMLEDIFFNEYERCNYVIITEKGDINPLNTFQEIKDIMQAEPIEVGIRKHGFGYKHTTCFKYPGVIFEVLHSGYIASITLSPVLI
jgi:Uncharacterised protein family (UPF0183)